MDKLDLKTKLFLYASKVRILKEITEEEWKEYEGQSIRGSNGIGSTDKK